MKDLLYACGVFHSKESTCWIYHGESWIFLYQWRIHQHIHSDPTTRHQKMSCISKWTKKKRLNQYRSHYRERKKYELIRNVVIFPSAVLLLGISEPMAIWKKSGCACGCLYTIIHEIGLDITTIVSIQGEFSSKLCISPCFVFSRLLLLLLFIVAWCDCNRFSWNYDTFYYHCTLEWCTNRRKKTT